jgi:putative NADH-flavin reductase
VKGEDALKLAVFGATGRTGRHLVEQALAEGHEVTVFVRDPSKLAEFRDRLRVVQGDVTDPRAVEEAVRGQEAVISALGPVKGGRKDLLAVATANIVAAMERHGVRRVVVESGAGMGVPEDHKSPGASAVGWLIGRLIPDQVEDKRRQLETLRDSGLEWVVVRAPVLTDGPRKGGYRLGYPPLGPGAQISRADIADAMLDQAAQPTFAGQAPAIRY